MFIEGQHATTVAYALGITPGRCLDVTGSLRSGIDALNLAAELVRSGVAARVLVVAADKRDFGAGSDAERLSGDAAAALVVSRGTGGIHLVGKGLVANPLRASWQVSSEGTAHQGDQRFVSSELLEPWLRDAVRAALADAAATTSICGSTESTSKSA